MAALAAIFSPWGTFPAPDVFLADQMRARYGAELRPSWGTNENGGREYDGETWQAQGPEGDWSALYLRGLPVDSFDDAVGGNRSLDAALGEINLLGRFPTINGVQMRRIGDDEVTQADPRASYDATYGWVIPQSVWEMLHPIKTDPFTYAPLVLGAFMFAAAGAAAAAASGTGAAVETGAAVAAVESLAPVAVETLAPVLVETVAPVVEVSAASSGFASTVAAVEVAPAAVAGELFPLTGLGSSEALYSIGTGAGSVLSGDAAVALGGGIGLADAATVAPAFSELFKVPGVSQVKDAVTLAKTAVAVTAGSSGVAALSSSSTPAPVTAPGAAQPGASPARSSSSGLLIVGVVAAVGLVAALLMRG